MRKNIFIRPRFAGAAACVALAVACSYAQQAPQHINKDVPYVPTLPEIVDEMLRLANVGKKRRGL